MYESLLNLLMVLLIFKIYLSTSLFAFPPVNKDATTANNQVYLSHDHVPKSASTPIVSKEQVIVIPSSLSDSLAITTTDASGYLSSGSPKEPSPYPTRSFEASNKSMSSLFPMGNKMHEAHSSGDLRILEGKTKIEEGKFAAGSRTTEVTRKKLHSQKLENIKFLTRAPSLDEMTSIMEELVAKSGKLSPNISASQKLRENQDTENSASSFAKKESNTPGEMSQEKSEVKSFKFEQSSSAAVCVPSPSLSRNSPMFTLPSGSEQTGEQKEESTKDKEILSPIPQFVDPLPSSKKSLRKSILEEMPVPTVTSQPLYQGSDGKGEATVTLPASPTIKRREIPTKIPTSPASVRKADDKSTPEPMEDERANRFRQEQRKLVSSIKTGSVKGSDDGSGQLVEVIVESGHQEKSEGTAVFSSSVTNQSAFSEDEEELVGGCALIMSLGLKDREVENIYTKENSSLSKPLDGNLSTETKNSESECTIVVKMPVCHANSSVTSTSRSGGVGARSQVQTHRLSTKQSVAVLDSLESEKSKIRTNKPIRARALSSTSSPKKYSNPSSACPASSPTRSSSVGDKMPSQSQSTAFSSQASVSSMKKQHSFSSTSLKEQSPTMCPRAVAMTKATEARLSKSSQSFGSSSFSSTTTSATSSKSSAITKLQETSIIKATKSLSEMPDHTKGGSSPLSSSLSSLSHGAKAVPSSSSPVHGRIQPSTGRSPTSASPSSSPKRLATRSVGLQRKSTTGTSGVIIVSSRKSHQEKQVTVPSQRQVVSSSLKPSKSGSQLSFTSSTSAVAASAASTPPTEPLSSSTVQATSGKLSQDRTPRFV